MDSSNIKQEVGVLIKEEIDLDDSCQLSSEGELEVPKSPNEYEEEFVPFDIKSEPEECLVDSADSSAHFDYLSPQSQDHNHTGDSLVKNEVRLFRKNCNQSQQKRALQDDSPSIDSVPGTGKKKRQLPRSRNHDHQCKVCSKRFTRVGHLKTHLLIHSGEKPHQCNLCKCRFTHACVLKRHLLTHSEEMPHCCTLCPSRFKSPGQLKAHMLIHTREKAHQCNLCPNRFKRPGDLKKHLLIHSGGKSYQCNVCGKSVKRIGSLKRHMLLHSGERPHLCHLCNKGFTQAGHLKRHLQDHNTSPGKRNQTEMDKNATKKKNSSLTLPEYDDVRK